MVENDDSSSRREAQLRQRQIAGLVLLALLVLAITLARAHWRDLFPTGWWRP